MLKILFVKKRRYSERWTQMKEYDELLIRIEKLREEMYKAIEMNSDLQNSQMLDISRRLDKYLVEYYRLLKEMKK